MAAETKFFQIDKPGWLAQIEAVLEALNEGVIITNDRREVLFANSRFVEMTGIPRPHLVGSDFSRFYSSREWNFLASQNDVSFRQGHNRYEFALPKEGGGSSRIL
jgi:PAS domain-containing protein